MEGKQPYGIAPAWAGKSLLRLTGEEWLRFLAECPLPYYGEFCYCEKCKGLRTAGEDEGCGHREVLLDKLFWKQVSSQIRRAWQKDRWLLARVKASFPARFQPAPLPEPLAWINEAWACAGKPPGRPPEVARAFLLDLYRNSLRLARLSGEPSNAVVRGLEEALKQAGSPELRDYWRALRWVRFWRRYPRLRLKGVKIRKRRSIRRRA